MPTRVLFADDDALTRRLLAHALAQHPVLEIVGEAVDGAQALALARLLKPDLVVLDVGMPELDGLEVATRLRAELPDTRIVVFSGSDVEEGAHAAGADRFVAKTAGFHVAAATVAELAVTPR